ncbi:MAG: metallophosphoesterase [Desulfobacterales bacterium]|nr:MAG: metallophosphoesterase [Desulfobacterales bacterium]
MRSRKTTRSETIIITDAHVGKAAENIGAFFRMLEAFEKTDHDLIFLGDIFDLWIAMPRYEKDIHAHFSGWCREQKTNRTIGFLEGNHEFFLADEKADTFTWCAKNAWRRDHSGVLFVHGDQINRKDRMYLCFKKLTKNKITKFILRNLPGGPSLIGSIQLGLNQLNNKYRGYIPEEEIKYFAESRFAEGIDTIFAGHFHREYCYRNDESKELYILPDWLSTQKITLYQERLKMVTTIHWKELDMESKSCQY